MYINILFIIIMIASIIFIAKQETLSKTLKGFVIMMMVFAVGFATLFEYSASKAEENTRPLINAFRQGKVLTCGTHDIDINTYSYEPGTSAFQPLLNVVGSTFAVKECIQK